MILHITNKEKIQLYKKGYIFEDLQGIKGFYDDFDNITDKKYLNTINIIIVGDEIAEELQKALKEG